MSDGKIYYYEPAETLANILEAIIDIILYGSTSVKTKNHMFCIKPLFLLKAKEDICRYKEYN